MHGAETPHPPHPSLWSDAVRPRPTPTTSSAGVTTAAQCIGCFPRAGDADASSVPASARRRCSHVDNDGERERERERERRRLGSRWDVATARPPSFSVVRSGVAPVSRHRCQYRPSAADGDRRRPASTGRDRGPRARPPRRSVPVRPRPSPLRGRVDRAMANQKTRSRRGPCRHPLHHLLDRHGSWTYRQTSRSYSSG
jgi:hypothetical protein